MLLSHMSDMFIESLILFSFIKSIIRPSVHSIGVSFLDFTVQDFADSTQSTKPGQAIRLKKADQNIFSSPGIFSYNTQFF